MSLKWTQAANVELEEAVQWYEEQLTGLGDKFLAEVAAAVALVERYPDAWHPLSKRTRSHRLNRFPYSLIYTTAPGGQAIVVAFAHQHRKPSYWKDRVGSAGG